MATQIDLPCTQDLLDAAPAYLDMTRCINRVRIRARLAQGKERQDLNRVIIALQYARVESENLNPMGQGAVDSIFEPDRTYLHSTPKEDNMKTNPKQLEVAEELRFRLLQELSDIDKDLGGLSPADPRRLELKSRKAELLPRYRGAKQNVKRLRRLVNASTQPKVQPTQEVESDIGHPTDMPGTLVLDVYNLMAKISCGDHLGNPEVPAAARDFMDWAEQFRTEDLGE